MTTKTNRIGGAAAAACLVAALLVAALGSTAAEAVEAPQPGDPAVAYWTDSEVVVADAMGQEVRRFPDFAKLSLNGGVIAGEIEVSGRGEARIAAFDAVSGERLYGIRNARLPVVTAGGRRIAFAPTSERDPYDLTVWMRGGTGKIRKIVQFATRGIPGIRTGMRGGAFPLDFALDERGRKLAVVAGLETLRSFDVWLIDVKTRAYQRLTKRENSHNPSVSPDGSRVVVRVERPEPCPDPIYGEILIGKLRVIDPATGERKTLTRWSCDLFYDTPRWIDNDTLVAVRVMKDATEELGYDLDLVTIDPASGTIDELLTQGNPCCISASASLGKIVHGFSDVGGLSMLDVSTGSSVGFSDPAYAPHMSGDNRF